jgi:hypothetical protein
MEPQNTQNTQMETGEDRTNLLSKRIIGCAVSQQHPMVVRYDGIVVGDYTVDLLVERIVLAL